MKPSFILFPLAILNPGLSTSIYAQTGSGVDAVQSSSQSSSQSNARTNTQANAPVIARLSTVEVRAAPNTPAKQSAGVGDLSATP